VTAGVFNVGAPETPNRFTVFGPGGVLSTVPKNSTGHGGVRWRAGAATGGGTTVGVGAEAAADALGATVLM
jgi:hypothetical protein